MTKKPELLRVRTSPDDKTPPKCQRDAGRILDGGDARYLIPHYENTDEFECRCTLESLDGEQDSLVDVLEDAINAVLPRSFWTHRSISRKQLEAIAARLREGMGGEVWKSMKTAPRDGTAVLIAWEDPDVVPETARWSEDDGFWYEANYHHPSDEGSFLPPDYWRPLRPPNT